MTAKLEVTCETCKKVHTFNVDMTQWPASGFNGLVVTRVTIEGEGGGPKYYWACSPNTVYPLEGSPECLRSLLRNLSERRIV